MRPSRNAATATSLAALYAHGIRAAALAGLAREREQRERAPDQEASKRSSSPADRSSGAAGVGAALGVA